MPMNLFARLTKVDEARREVWGRLVQETPDHADEIFDYESSKPHFKAWSDSFVEATGGKSLGNLRAMHGKVSAGKFIAMDFNDEDRAIDVGAKVVDDQEWAKVLEGCYTGFSIGGQYVGPRKAEKIGDREVMRYTAKPAEGSLVDLPCIPTAKFFDVIKADGSTLQKEFRPAAPAPLDVNGTEQDVADFAALLNAEGLTMREAIERVKTTPVAKGAEGELAKPLIESDTDEARDANIASEVRAGRSPEQAAAIAYSVQRKARRAKRRADKLAGDKETLRKGMFAVQMFADCLDRLSDICRGAGDESEWEGDNSPIPAALQAWLVEGVNLFVEMADEEATELVSGLKAPEGSAAAIVARALETVDLRKRLTSPDLPLAELAKLAAEHEEPLTTAVLADMPALVERIVAKAGARHSKVDAAHLQEAHDHLTAMGATCGEGADKAKPAGDLAKGADDLAAQLAAALDRIKKLEAQPMPSVVTLRALAKPVSKVVDGAAPDGAGTAIDPSTIELTPSDPLVRNADGTVDYYSSRLMKARRIAASAQ